MPPAEKPTLLRGLRAPLLLFAIPLAVAILFSLFSTPGIRGIRNLGILACYGAVVAGGLKLGWKRTLLAWAGFGVLSGLLYFGYEVVSYAQSDAADRSARSGMTILYGLVAWPIMAPEVVEYTLAGASVLGGEGPTQRPRVKMGLRR